MKVINYCFGLFATIVFLGCNYNSINNMFDAPLPSNIDKDDTGFKDFTRKDERNFRKKAIYRRRQIKEKRYIDPAMFLDLAKSVKPINRNKMYEDYTRNISLGLLFDIFCCCCKK
ncbi:MAG: hypothetical protein GY830_01545 [Bacteroidetes bacterium]|nr:hypothetical protein [Bacteroidota bacterium]